MIFVTDGATQTTQTHIRRNTAKTQEVDTKTVPFAVSEGQTDGEAMSIVPAALIVIMALSGGTILFLAVREVIRGR